MSLLSLECFIISVSTWDQNRIALLCVSRNINPEMLVIRTPELASEWGEGEEVVGTKRDQKAKGSTFPRVPLGSERRVTIQKEGDSVRWMLSKNRRALDSGPFSYLWTSVGHVYLCISSSLRWMDGWAWQRWEVALPKQAWWLEHFARSHRCKFKTLLGNWGPRIWVLNS